MEVEEGTKQDVGGQIRMAREVAAQSSCIWIVSSSLCLRDLKANKEKNITARKVVAIPVCDFFQSLDA